MANDKRFIAKNGLQTQNIALTSANLSSTITAGMLDSGTLTFSGTSGQLFSITDSMSGTIFSVNDISGIPSIEVLDTGNILLAQFSGNILVGTATDNGNKINLQGNLYTTGNITATGVVSSATISTSGNTAVGGNLTVTGDLTVNGTTTTVNSTTISVDDKNIELGSVASPSDTTADGGGITLKGATDKTFSWLDATDSWTSSEHIALVAGKTLRVTGLSSGTAIITAPSAAGTPTLTLPTTTGTFALLQDNLGSFAATTSAQLAGVISDETGSGALTFATSPVFTTSIDAASVTMGLFDTTATTVNAFGATTTLNLGYDSTAASTTNISIGAVAASVTKTVNLATGGDASSITNINIGASAGGGTTTISSPNITISGLADTATTATHYYVETTGGNILPKTLSNARTELVTTAAVNAAAATTTGTVTSGTWSASFGSVSGANLTNLTAGNLSGTIPSTVLANSSLFVGTTSIALNRASANLALTGITSVAMPGSTSGTITITPAAIAGTTAITIPATAGTLITTGDSGTVTSTMILDGTIVNGDINASAAIVDTKLATISTAGKVSNSATTATNTNTASAIVARDASGNFTAGTITAALSGNATTASAWAAARTITLGGDLTGNVSVSGSADVTLTATIAANSVALGTDTTGNYMSDLTQGTGISITHTPGEGSNATIAHADTSTVANLTATSRTYVTALTFDTFGHVTAYSTGTESTSAGTTYTQSAVTTTGGAFLRLSGSDASTDDVKFASGTNVTVAFTDANTITISANDTSVALGTETTGNYVASITNGTYITGGNGGSAGAALTLAVDATSANTASKIVARDASGNFAAGTITAALTGNASTATTLATARTIAISGDVTGTATSFNGSADITISSAITADSIVNADINSAAAIADTKLATISTAGKVSNSATTATALNTINAIVARDASGNFAAGTITAALSGNASTASAWAAARTITLGGDLTGNVSISGSADVTLTATVAANSVALGTDTTGNYVATLAAGTPGAETTSSGLTISAAAGESTAATIAHADTSTLSGAQGSAGIAAITVDGFGHVTAVTTATYLTSQSSDFGTVTVTDTDTGFTWASTGSAVADTAGDTITFVDGGGIDIDVDAATDAIRIQHTDTSSVANLTATSRTYVTALTFDTYGHVTAYSTAAETVVDTDTTSLPIENSAGTAQFTATQVTGLQFAASGIASVAFDAVNYRVTVSATEADTLDTVTGRGATTANSITVGDIAVNGGDITTNQTTFGLIDTAATTVNAFGATTTLNLGYDGIATSTTNISIGAVASGVIKTINIGTGSASGSTTNINLGSATGGTTTVNSNLTVSGNLVVNGTTTTVNSTTVTLDDPIITLGGDTALSVDDNKDRGVEFRWHNGTSAKLGFFGFDDSTGYFTFIPDATNTSEVFSGTKGVLDVSSITGSAATLTNTRNINGVAFDGSADITITSNTANALTIGTGLSGTSFNGSSAVTVAIDSTVATLTGSQILTNKTISGTSNTLSNIGNASLTNSSTTIGTTAISLGASSTTLTGLVSVTSTSFVGALTGNATTASAWATGRTITLGGDLTGSVSINGSTNVTLNSTIANSVALAGTPTAPTAAAGTNTTQIATTEFVQSAANVYTTKTANYTATSGDKILTDTTAGGFTVTLPAGPTAGSTVVVYDIADWQVNNLTVARNGSTIEGIADNFVLDLGQIKVDFVYSGTTWHVYASVGPAGPTGPAGTSISTATALAIALG